MQPCIATVWSSGAAEPGLDRLPLDQPLPLDRDLFGGTDSTISRADNAPRLVSSSSRRARLVIPPQCATGVVVLHGLTFDTLQRRIASYQEDYPRARVANLGRSLLVARGAHSALALLRSASPDPDRPDQLVALPQSVKLMGPAELELPAPAIVIVGSGAVAVAPGITVFPDSGANLVDHCRRFRLPKLESADDVERALLMLKGEPPSGLLRIAGYAHPFGIEELPLVARAVLRRVGQRAWFAPVLVEDREPRLCLLYARRGEAAGGVLSSADIPSWLAQVELLCAHRRAASPTATPQPRSGYRVVSGGSSQSVQAEAVHAATTPLATPARLGSVQTRHAGFARDLRYLESMRNLDLGVLILGESGTGKEHLARALHAQSKRAAAPFFPINVSALTESLIVSELFGHVKGAFTGTDGARGGAFVAANGGTLLLDEIADAPLAVQLALLRVLESRTIRPAGADQERAVDVRVIAATSRDLLQLVRDGRFREDLYHRIAEVTVTLPPLRERAADLPHIVRTLLNGLGSSLELTPEALATLQRQRWSGNIRALQMALRQAAQLAQGCEAITPEHLQRLPDRDPLQRAAPAPAPSLPAPILAVVPPPIEFPELVRTTGDELWTKEQLPPLRVSGYERRALHRAALIYLAAQRDRKAFSAALAAQWRHLFGARWSQTENHRGLREVLRLLGATLRDEEARGWVLGVVGA